MKKVMQLVTLFACVLGMTACGSGKKDTASSTEKTTVSSSTATTTSSSEEKTYQVVGVKSDTASKALVKNSTGQEIKAVAIKAAEQTEYPANMLSENATIKNEDTVQLFYTPENKEGEQKYTVQVTFADDTVHEISNFNFSDFDPKSEVEVGYDGTVAFLKYKNKAGQVVDTKEQELAAKAEKDAAAQAEAAANADAQAAADALAAQETANAQPTVDNNQAAADAQAAANAAAQQPAAPVEQQPAAPAAPAQNQGADNCLDDGAMFN
ncbi:hypothetical protein ACYSNR_09755 [Enterococcus sp. LJL128]